MPASDMLEVYEELENYIEDQFLTCRVYTKNRIVAGLLNPSFGILSLASIAVHNILTYNPDYDIWRDIANDKVSVVYKRTN